MTSYEFAVNGEKSNDGKRLKAELIGTLDSHTVLNFEKDIDALLKEPVEYVVLSLDRLTYISSAGISALMQLTHSLRQRNGELILVSPTDKVMRVLRTLGFTNIFRIVNNEQDAESITA